MDRSEFVDLVDYSESSAFFDEAIGHIQDIILSEEFQELHEKFFEEHWTNFEYDEENKIEYMIIYESYQLVFENYLSEQLHRSMPEFSMHRFDMELHSERSCCNIVDNEIVDLIDTITDFQKFKEEMLSYRFKKEGGLKYIDAGNILVTKSIGQGEENRLP